MDRRDDLPRRFLELVSAGTPARRRDWSRAMLAELDQVAGTAARWRFALGAARVTLIPPASGRLTTLVLAVLAAAAAVAIHMKAPAAGLVAAVAIPALPATGAWVALARPQPPRRVGWTGRAVQVIAVAAVIACPVFALRVTVLYPGQSGRSAPYIGYAMTVIFAAELAAYLLLILRRPGPLRASRPGGLLGLAAAAVTGLVCLLSQPPGGQSDSPVVNMAVQATAIGAPVVAGLLACIKPARGRRPISPWAGISEMVWGWLLIGPVGFIVDLLTTSDSAVVAESRQSVFITEAHQQGAASITAWVAQDDLGGAIVIFTLLSFAALVVFLVGYTMFRWGEPAEPRSGEGGDDVVAVGG
jgi:hypothetical protein